MEQLEIEVNFYPPDIESMRRRILALGAESKGRVFENNIRYEDDGNSVALNSRTSHSKTLKASGSIWRRFQVSWKRVIRKV
jgi:hypothetical protein